MYSNFLVLLATDVGHGANDLLMETGSSDPMACTMYGTPRLRHQNPAAVVGHWKTEWTWTTS